MSQYKIDYNLVCDYLQCIADTQDLSFSESASLILPKGLNRAFFHEQMCVKFFGFDVSNEPQKYIAFKYITDNLDKVCALYSECDEWKLKTKRDIKFMAKYLTDFLSKTEVQYFIDGEIDNLICLEERDTND